MSLKSNFEYKYGVTTYHGDDRQGHGSNEVLPILVLANEFSNQGGVSVLCIGFLAAQMWSTKGGVAEYGQLVPDVK